MAAVRPTWSFAGLGSAPESRCPLQKQEVSVAIFITSQADSAVRWSGCGNGLHPH
jgi:hypothetical protein